MSFQAITNFLLNSNSVNLQDNLINLQSDDFNNSKISNYSLSKTETEPIATTLMPFSGRNFRYGILLLNITAFIRLSLSLSVK